MNKLLTKVPTTSIGAVAPTSILASCSKGSIPYGELAAVPKTVGAYCAARTTHETR